MAKDSNVQKAKQKALNQALKRIKKEFGKGSIMKMSDRPQHVEAIPSGSLAIDNTLGIGGYPKGRVVEIYGPESAGKTTLALEAAASVQRNGGIVAYIDAENALSPDYAQALGVNVKNLILSQPDTGEEGMQICENLAKSGAIDLIVVDSVAALVPKAEIQGEMGDAHVGLQARLMSQSLRAMSGTLSRTHTTCIFINQIREKVGVIFGSPETTPGGQALKFYSSVILRISRGQKIKNGKEVIGNHAKVTVRKNKVAPPFRSCHVDIMYGTGISHVGELLDMAVDKDIVDKAGAWFSYGDTRIGQGRENAKEYLVNHVDMAKEINVKVHQAYHIPMSKTEKIQMKKSSKPNSASKKTTKSDSAKPKK